MMLKTVAENHGFSSSLVGFGDGREKKNGYTGIVSALQESEPMTGIVFQPFEEVKSDNFMVPVSSKVSLARQKFVDDCEAAINEQI
ncbi:Ferritin-1 chloroplastic, partial [Bienertia sinuspersici]